MRQLIIDTETTGLDPYKGHRIIEFAALEMVNRKLTGKFLHIYINPEREIDKEATKIHGITNEHLIDKPIFKDISQKIVEFIKGAELIIHNAKFDLNFLDHHFNMEKVGITHDYVCGVIDTLILARQKFPGSKNSLDALCDRFNIDRSNRGFHGALIDCHLLSDVYIALTREQISLLEAEERKNIFEEFSYNQLDTSNLNLKISSPSEDEEKLHNSYLKVLHEISSGNSIWYNKVNKFD